MESDFLEVGLESGKDVGTTDPGGQIDLSIRSQGNGSDIEIFRWGQEPGKKGQAIKPGIGLGHPGVQRPDLLLDKLVGTEVLGCQGKALP